MDTKVARNKFFELVEDIIFSDLSNGEKYDLFAKLFEKILVVITK